MPSKGSNATNKRRCHYWACCFIPTFLALRIANSIQNSIFI